MLARLLTDPVWWLYLTWLPLYLSKVRGFSLKDIALFAWVPYVAADAGSLLGGWTSGYLISRGWTVNRARKTVILCAALLIGQVTLERHHGGGGRHRAEPLAHHQLPLDQRDEQVAALAEHRVGGLGHLLQAGQRTAAQRR